MEHQNTIKNYFKPNTVYFWFMHLACTWAVVLPFRRECLYWAVALYSVRMFFVTGDYHRYFSHRAFSTNRIFQFILAFMAMTSSHKGILWWARMGWIFSHENSETNVNRIKDFLKFLELFWLDCFGRYQGLFMRSLCIIFLASPDLSGVFVQHCFFMALITLGEGWHNNHHRYPKSVRNGSITI